MNRHDLIQQLKELHIDYQLYEHPAIFTVSEFANFPKEIKDSLAGSVETKNLFLRDEKRQNYILICMRAETRVRLKDLGRQMGLKGITFCSTEELETLLGITPGSVCLFTLANDINSKVRGYMDDSIPLNSLIQNHPLDNTATLVLTASSLIRFCSHHDHEIAPLTLPADLP